MKNKSKQLESLYDPDLSMNFEVQSMSIHDSFNRYKNWNAYGMK